MSRLFYEKDPFAPIRYCYEMPEVLYSLKTEYNEIMVIRNDYFGRMLILNDVVQLTERDEYFYHEMLAHLALHAHPSPTDVSIIGGGDGGTLREVLKHGVVERALIVEIDQEVIEVSRRFFPTLSTGFDDPRVHIVAMDGADFLAETKQKFDLIIVDSTDPVGTAEPLFTSQFFTHAFSALKADGIFVAQTESLHFHQEFVRDVQHRLAQVFKFVDLYTVPLATYAGNWWTFSIASKKHNPREIARKCEVSTRYYAEDVHQHAFLPRSLYQKLIGGRAVSISEGKGG